LSHPVVQLEFQLQPAQFKSEEQQRDRKKI